MKRLILSVFLVSLFGPSFAATPAYQIHGDLTEACPCNSACPCHFGSDTTYGHCEGSLAFHIQKGRYGNIPLDGLTVIGTSWFGKNMKAAIGKMPARMYVDQRANPAQRKALQAIFTEQFGGMFGKVYPTRYIPMQVTNHGNYSTIKSSVLNLDIQPTKAEDGGMTRVEHAPLAVIPSEYIGTSKVYRFSDPTIKKQWTYKGRHANFGTFDYSSKKPMGKMEHM